METEVHPLKMTEKLTNVVNRYWQDVWESKHDGRLVAWCTGNSPAELLRMMDITVVLPEMYGAMCATAGLDAELCQRAESLGYSPDLCSVVRNFMGAIHSTGALEQETLPYGGLPKPDLLVCMPYCPGVYKTWEKWSRFFNIPLLVIERPYLHDGLNSEEIAHLVRNETGQLEEMVTFLERFTGCRFDYDRLCRSLALEQEATGLWQDVLEMCRNVPAPMSAFDAFTHIFPLYMYKCTPEVVIYYQELKSELAERVANRIPMVADEKYRLYWDNLPIYYKTEEHIRKFASYGAVPVVAMFPFVFGRLELNLEKPLESVAELLLFNRANRGLKWKIEFLTKLVEGYSVDGLIMQRSRTCLLANMGQDDLMKALTERTGLPAVVVEADICDSRFYSDSEFNSKIDAFMEMLAHRDQQRG